MNIGTIKKVHLREIWKHEAYDFTNWLAEEANLSLLADELGISLLNPQTEVGVGKFSVDILAEDDRDHKVIIENQLEATNHDHLGKIITYAAGLQAETIIWVVARANEEHEQAINWLNENTTEQANFFLVKIEAWKIDNSVPAPRFNIIAKPNDWAKIVRQSGNNNVTELRLKQQEFWNKLRQYGDENSKYVKSWQKAHPQMWYNITIGTSKARLAGTIHDKDGFVGMELYIMDNKELFYSLFSHKEEIETQLGYSLDWQELPKKKSARIITTKKGDFRDDAQEHQLIEWLHDKAELFTKVFKRYL